MMRNAGCFTRMLPIMVLVTLVSGMSLGACVKVSYIGETLSPTENVDVFYSTDDITRPYRTIGRAELSATAFNTLEAMRERAIEEAKKRGADAVVLGSPGKRGSGTWSSSVSGTQATGQEYQEKVLPALFIVYE